MFDPTNLFSRLLFLESDIRAINKKFQEHSNEFSMIKRRIYSISPNIESLIPHPSHSKTRALYALKSVYDSSFN